MVREEILKYVFIVQSGHIKILLVSRDQLFLFMSRNHLFVSFIVKCPILAYFCISHHEKKAATLLLLSKCPGSSEPACTETTAVCSSLQFPCRLFNAGHSGRCIIHGGCPWAPASNDTLKGCYCASLVRTTNTNLVQTMQANVNNDCILVRLALLFGML